ncbi:N-acylglucosamine 2-epimerase [Burkholderia singularis]|uniref:N-acylglucosamine 2-epimerase n=1 Tax=Burkholderia singularis TaxID=1503053 RepID=A0A103E1R0_9BURK|nr:AGE family epimerase/isomerase [Burkholderia singularis]KVE26817.1 N-acylglucosamine 2-epimerase [Burkholderia singularis]
MTTSATPAPHPAIGAPQASRPPSPASGAHAGCGEPAVPRVESFRDRQFLLSHVQHTLRFYAPNVLDPSGGFYHFFRDDGTVYDRTTRHLVSSCRFVFNYAMAYRHFGNPRDLDYARHGLRFLRDAHWDAAHEGYDWEIEWRDGVKRATRDGTRHCYGLAFVLLAAAHAAMAGIDEAKPLIAQTFELMEHRFWDAAAGLYADDATPDWSVSSYRGQNANMHATEALLAAYEATGHLTYLDRAEKVATHIVQRQAALSNDLVWEHFRADWSVDWEYNKEDSSNIFRPWGFQPGHQTEWAKLLLILERHRPLDWLLPRAIALFDAALAHAWDADHGGLCYGFDPDYKVCDHDKYFWVQAESLAAAALLGQRTGSERFWDWYDEIWRYSWTHFVDHHYGAWYRILTCDNRKYSDEKSPAGKTDYHTMGACYEVLNALPAPHTADGGNDGAAADRAAPPAQGNGTHAQHAGHGSPAGAPTRHNGGTLR